MVAVLGVLAAACSASGQGRRDDPEAREAPDADRSHEPERACDEPTLIGTVRVPAIVAHDRPDPHAPVLATFDRVNDQGATQVFPLLDRATRSGRDWYRAMLPTRPNGSTGWIAARDVELGQTGYRIEIDLERFRLRLLDGCDRIERFPIGVGTQDTPTPRGTFFLNSLLKPPERGTVYGALAFGLSAYSNVIRDWEGGGIVGLHGTNDPSSIGRQASHGCIRMPNDAIRFLAQTVPLGTPVEIT